MIKLFKGFGYAFSGILHCIKAERNFRIHIVALVLVTWIAYIYGTSPIESAVLAITIGMVIALESVNTAIEKTVDICSMERTRSAKVAKDASAGAVLISAIASVFVAIFIFSDTERLEGVFVFLSSALNIFFIALFFVFSALFVFVVPYSKDK